MDLFQAKMLLYRVISDIHYPKIKNYLYLTILQKHKLFFKYMNILNIQKTKILIIIKIIYLNFIHNQYFKAY